MGEDGQWVNFEENMSIFEICVNDSFEDMMNDHPEVPNNDIEIETNAEDDTVDLVLPFFGL